MKIKGSGETFTFSQLDRLYNNGDGTYTAIVKVYTGSSGFTGDPHGTREQWLATEGDNIPQMTSVRQAVICPAKDDIERYILIEYTEVKDI